MRTWLACSMVVAALQAQAPRHANPGYGEVLGLLVGHGRIEILDHPDNPTTRTSKQTGLQLPERSLSLKNSHWSRWVGEVEAEDGRVIVAKSASPYVYDRRAADFKLYDQHKRNWVWVRIKPLDDSQGENLRYRSLEEGVDEVITQAHNMIKISQGQKLIDIPQGSECLLTVSLPESGPHGTKWGSILPLERKGDLVRGTIGATSPVASIKIADGSTGENLRFDIGKTAWYRWRVRELSSKVNSH